MSSKRKTCWDKKIFQKYLCISFPSRHSHWMENIWTFTELFFLACKIVVLTPRLLIHKCPFSSLFFQIRSPYSNSPISFSFFVLSILVLVLSSSLTPRGRSDVCTHLHRAASTLGCTNKRLEYGLSDRISEMQYVFPPVKQDTLTHSCRRKHMHTSKHTHTHTHTQNMNKCPRCVFPKNCCKHRENINLFVTAFHLL